MCTTTSYFRLIRLFMYAIMVSFFAIPTLYAQQETDDVPVTQPMDPIMASQAGTPLIKEEKKPKFLRDLHLNLYLRSSLEVPFHKGIDLGVNDLLGGFRQNEARFEMMGKVWKGLTFRMRVRLSTSRPALTLTRSNDNIDFALVGYQFGRGERKPFLLEVGKQNTMIGSWEFWENPTFEYQYSTIGGGPALNNFPLGARFSYTPVEGQTFTLQAYSTLSDGFPTVIGAEQQAFQNLRAARLPLTYVLAWKGEFFDKKWLTWYSFALNRFAKDKDNYHLAITNQWVIPRFRVYLDLVSTYMNLDYTNHMTPAYTNYRENLLRRAGLNPAEVFPSAGLLTSNLFYSSAVFRLDWEFVPRLSFVGKAWYERADAVGANKALGAAFRNNVAFLTGLEFKPVKSQALRIFTYYYRTQNFYNKNVTLPGTVNNIFAIGALYFVEAF